MTTQLRNMLIGVFLIAGIATLVGFVMFLRPSVGDEKQTLYVRFSNINKINVGTRVLFAGQAVGEVTDVSQIYHARETQPSDELGRLYFYQLTLKIDSNVKVYNTDEISIQTSGLLGEKSIAIIPKTPAKGVISERITEKTPFYADSIDPIENTFNRLSAISEKLDDTIEEIRQWIVQNRDNLTHAVVSFGSAMDQIDNIGQKVQDEELIAQIKDGAHNFTSSMAKVDDALARMQKDGVFDNFGDLIANLTSSSSSIDLITQDIANGKGTLGRLITGDDFYLRMTAVMSKVDTLMNDINHYGMLFHLNKGWQRARTKRLTTLNALDTPEGFQQYFQTEIDQINTAMARLNMLIDKAKTKPVETRVMDSPKFREDFAELLREVDEMSDNLRLYNEELAETLKGNNG